MNDCFCGSDASAWRVDEKIETFLSVETMNSQHEAVHVLVVDVKQLDAWFGKKARIVSDYVPVGLFEEFPEIFPANRVVRGYTLWLRSLGLAINFLKDVMPVRQSKSHWFGIVLLFESVLGTYR